MGLRDAERHPRELSSGRVPSSHTPVRAALGITARNRSALNTSRGSGRAAHEKCLVSNQRTLGVQRPDLSYVKEPAQGVAPLASLGLFRARPGGQHLERIFRSGLEGVDRLEREITVYREDLSNPR